jgi:hypothetical protein
VLAAANRVRSIGGTAMRKQASHVCGLTLLLVGTLYCQGSQGPEEPLEDRRQIGDLVFESIHPPQIARDSLIARMVVTNTADTTVQVSIAGGCQMTVRILKDRNEPPAWDSQHALALGDCVASLETLTLEPRVPKTFQSTVAVFNILGDSLRRGRYFVESTLQLDQEVVLQNGEVTLK